MLTQSKERGDTLIEVLLAVVILSIVTLGAFAIMNRGVAISYGVLERTETRARISQQLELLSYFRDQHIQALTNGTGSAVYPGNMWAAIKSNYAASTGTSNTGCTPAAGSFFIEPYTTGGGARLYRLVSYTPNTPDTTPQAGRGLWIEAVASLNISVRYVDFYVKACWNSVSRTGQETVSSAMRLYDR